MAAAFLTERMRRLGAPFLCSPVPAPHNVTPTINVPNLVSEESRPGGGSLPLSEDERGFHELG